MSKLSGALTLVAVAGCGTRPTLVPTSRPTMAIQASVDATWQAVTDVFGQEGIGLRIQDHRSGSGITNKGVIRERDRGAWSVCGNSSAPADRSGNGSVPADHVVFTIHIGGDSTTSTINVAARFTREDVGAFAECTSKGAWEYSMERRIKARAEGGSTS